ISPARGDHGVGARRSQRRRRPPGACQPQSAAEAMTGRSGVAPGRPGRVRVARLTDLAALGELSRLCQSDQAETRSLGLPVSGPPIGMFSLFRLPLGAFRPNDLLYVYEE